MGDVFGTGFNVHVEDALEKESDGWECLVADGCAATTVIEWAI
jgi:hypothetical protein